MFGKELSQVSTAPSLNYTLVMVGVLSLVFAPTLVVWLLTIVGTH